MQTVKNFTTIHLKLKYIDVLEVVILLMTYLIKYVLQLKHPSMFNMITEMNESKILTMLISGKCKFKFDERKCNKDTSNKM